jgi:hypothetical protein
VTARDFVFYPKGLNFPPFGVCLPENIKRAFGTLNGVVVFGSWLDFEKVEGLSRKCFSSVLILVPLAGWSDRSGGICHRSLGQAHGLSQMGM